MLWKPPSPIYPRLIEDAPAGLSLEEANLLRKAGYKLEPLMKLSELSRLSLIISFLSYDLLFLFSIGG